MIQLSYQPAFDPFHTMFRLLRVREAVLNKTALHEEQLKLIDFYLLFPFRIDRIRLRPAHRKYRRLAKDYQRSKPYGGQSDDVSVFNRMDAMQSVALDTMAAKGLIDPIAYEVGSVARTDESIPAGLLARVKSANANEQGLMDFLVVLATEYNLLGEDGLKHRTGLVEYRYDAA